MSDLLLEIGCENLPPASIRPAFEQLGRIAAQRLEENRLPSEEVYTTGTPRRLVLIVRGLAPGQRSQTETVTGPPVSKAFAEDGKPTKAALGFARSQGVAVGDLRRIPTERGEYVGVTRRLKARRASALLKEILPGIISELKFPKVMHWEKTGTRFARPIRWLVAILGDRVIRFTVAGVSSADSTHTVPWIRRDRIRVRGANHYLAQLRKAGVVVDHEERYEKIRRLARRAAAGAGLELVEDPSLFAELTFMLEDPRDLVGTFDEKYLKLPSEVVVTAMKAHQRYLALRGKRKRLVARFVTFTEGRVGSPAAVRRGNEKVLRARLEDAHFYWREDVTTGIERLADKLGSIVFIEGLGTLADKSARIESLARHLRETVTLGRGLVVETMVRAARLAKADLASEMIKDGKEFTLLQGMIGSRYAHQAGEGPDIVAALREQYAPRGPSDPVPKTALGAILGIADRVDTITGCFLAGLTPSGSQDPYALRRLANGLIRILKDKPDISIQPLLAVSIGCFEAQKVRTEDGVQDRLAGFFQRRTETFLREKGIAYDVVAAVSAVAWSRPALALQRALAMETARGNEAFELLITGARRVGNILEPAHKITGVDWRRLEAAFLETAALTGELRFDPDRFEEDAERKLYDEIKKAIPRMIESDAREDAASVFEALAGLGPAIDRYFDRVLVNCPDPGVRTNRHHFLANVFALFSKYADFSYIVEEGAAPMV
ncbi:MAG: glycine--tRNA ligase subunit beta [Candidatus Krumholzibacteriia bacterium]